MIDAAHIGLHGELPHRVARFGIGEHFNDIGGVFKGAGEQLVDTVTGVVDTVTHPVETVTGIVSLVTDPKQAWPALWRGIADPIAEDWRNGNPGEAIGRGLFGILEAVVGTKGVTKVAKALNGIPDVPDPALPRMKPKLSVPDGPSRPDAPKRPRKPTGADKPDPKKPMGPIHDARTSAAMLRLEESGAKFSRADIVWADEVAPATSITTKHGVLFLEHGNARAGLQHILHGDSKLPGSTGHLDDFARKGVDADQVPDLIRTAVTKGDASAVPGKKGTYDISVDFEGTKQKLRVAIGNNGFIVSAFPV